MKLFFLYLLTIVSYAIPLHAQDTINIGFKRHLYSNILQEERVVLIHLPPHFQKGKAYPTVYLLDASINFNYFVTIADFLSRGSRGHIPEMIVVGIENVERTRDLTPTQSFVTNLTDTSIKLFENSGGGEAFLRFIQEELKPFVAKQYAEAAQSILVGHSFGGLMTIDCLRKHPDYFDCYIANDPSLWWDSSYEVKQWQQQIPTSLSGKRLFVAHTTSASGAKKNHFGKDGPEANKQFKELLLHSATALKYVDTVYPKETHGTISLPGNIEGLKFLFR